MNDRPSSPANSLNGSLESCNVSEACCDELSQQLRPELFKALADPVRITLVCRLAVATEAMTVSDVADCCGVHLSGVSRHLSTLHDAGIVQRERVGREARYRLDCAGLATTLRAAARALDACHAACHPGETP